MEVFELVTRVLLRARFRAPGVNLQKPEREPCDDQTPFTINTTLHVKLVSVAEDTLEKGPFRKAVTRWTLGVDLAGITRTSA